MRSSIVILLSWCLSFVLGCVATPYKKNSGFGGYSDKKLEDGLNSAIFSANPQTPATEARLNSLIRAIQVCSEKHQPAFIVILRDTSETTLNYSSSSYALPVGNGAMAVSQGTTSTVVYPSFVTTFACQDKIHMMKVGFVERTAEEMKSVMNDLLPGLQITKVLPGSPNKGILEVGDIIVKVNGERIADTTSSLWAIIRTGQDVPVTLIRDGKRIDVGVKKVDVTLDETKKQTDLLVSRCETRAMYHTSLCADARARLRQPANN